MDIRFSEIGYKKILDTMTESIWIGDENERTIYANPNFCQLLGYELHEMIGKESYEFWDEESSRTVQQNNRLRQKGVASKYEWVLKAKNGELIPVLLSGTPLENGGTAGIMTDLREIQAVREQAKHFEEINNLKNEFISMVGHELRTPMTGVKGYLSMIVDGDTGPITEKTEEFLKIVLKESERLIEMINDMLDVAKLEAEKIEFHPEILKPSELAYEVFTSLKFLALDRGIELVFEADDLSRDVYVSADPSKLKQVLINLAGNALKFTPKNGKVTLKISADKTSVHFEVRDTGIGILKSNQEKIFEKFKQVDSYLQKTVTGTGLGLYICSKILAHFDSELKLDSEIGKGSNFYFTIPRIP